MVIHTDSFANERRFVSFAFSNVGAPGIPGSCQGGRCFGALIAISLG